MFCVISEQILLYLILKKSQYPFFHFFAIFHQIYISHFLADILENLHLLCESKKCQYLLFHPLRPERSARIRKMLSISYEILSINNYG